MNKFSKIVATFASAVLVAGNVMGLAACSQTGNEDGGGIENTKIVTGNVNSVAYDGSKVTITFFHTMGAALRGILDNNIARFNKMYPNIKVAHSSYGDYDGLRDQITTEMQGAATAPSLAYCYPDHVALYNKSKAVLTMDAFINHTGTVSKADGSIEQVGFTQAQLDDFITTYYEEGKVYGDDKMYTLPMLKSTEVLYYNKTYFDAHADQFSVPTTWEEMENVCKLILEEVNAKNEAIKEENKNLPDDKKKGLVKCVPLGYDSESNWFITMTEQLKTPYTSASLVDGTHFLFNTEENREFVAMFRDWYQKDYLTTEALNGDTYTSNLFKETDETKLHTYMSIGSSAGAGYQNPDKLADGSYPFEVGIAMIPQANPEDPKVISQGPSLCMFKKANEQEMAAAWLFAKFLTTDVTLQASLSMNNGYTSAIKSVTTNSTYASFLAKADNNQYLQASVINKTIEMEPHYYTSPAFYGSSAAREAVGTLMQTCLGTSNVDIVKEFNDTWKALNKRYD